MKCPPLRLLPTALALTVFALIPPACGGDDDDKSGPMLERLLTRGAPEDLQARAFVGEMPAGMPWEIPQYAGSEVLGSLAIEQPELSAYFIMLDSDDPAAEVLDFYEAALDEDPWQAESFVSSEEFTGLQFSKIDDADVTGTLTVDSLLEGGTSIALSLQIMKQNGPVEEEGAFQLEPSRPLPSGFPTDVPLYPGSTVIETSWLRSPGHVDFLVVLVTPDIQEDVIDFYREGLADRGFTVNEETAPGVALAISFSDVATGDLEGSVVSDVFEEDRDYTRVDLQLRVGSARRRVD